jgi:hypothetical protein
VTCELSSCGGDLEAETAFCCVAAYFGVSASMTVNHVEPCYIGAGRDGVLIYTEATRIGEVGAQNAEALEDVGVVDVTCYWYLCFQRVVGDVGDSWERGEVGLCEIGCIAGLCRTWSGLEIATVHSNEMQTCEVSIVCDEIVWET